MFLHLVFFSVLATRCKTRYIMLKIYTEIMTTHATKKSCNSLKLQDFLRFMMHHESMFGGAGGS
ncbi:hypothetical protein SEES8400_05266 [Salmonella enterica subsp. enterica serovar Senftenberg str. ATCC 8400]|nr:hypothetical protein SEES8400_05266 [Salmonella enterica subsp. enterica serovar Senftenberg str. ATCC 8400]